MEAGELNGLILTEFPELRREYEDDQVLWGGDEYGPTGSYIICACLLNPYLRLCLDDDDKGAVQRVFNFLESLLELGDDYVDNVVAVGVVEMFLYSLSDEMRDLLGPLARRDYDEMRAWDAEYARRKEAAAQAGGKVSSPPVGDGRAEGSI
ncbi:MAG: hypothetical protein LBJ44_08455 [Propionibacteriaceae bacterium]|jgi:hypothetical protein|nr:hypothetical protein [Propionibacteriaceae bacterium]